MTRDTPNSARLIIVWGDMNLKYAIRLLIKDPWFTFVAVLALGLGIGVNSTVFTFVNAVLLRGLPFADGDQIVHINSRNMTEGNALGVSYADYQDWRAQTKSFESLAGYQGLTANISDSGHPPERANGTRVTANAFGVIGERPVRGRNFGRRTTGRGRSLLPSSDTAYGRHDTAATPTSSAVRSRSMKSLPP